MKPNKFLALLTSRKFWALAAALVAATASYATAQVDPWQALIAAITALSVYTASTAVEDGLRAR